MDVGDRVRTPDGEGVIIGIDLPESLKLKRYIVELDERKYSFDPAYFGKELNGNK